jgi:vitamin B12 transporter
LNVSSGFRAPSLYQLFSEYGNRELDPEKAETYEGGLQYYAKGGRSNIRLLFFDRELRDAIVFFTDPVSYRSYYINQDKQSDQGLELESVLRLNKFATLKISYTYLTGSVTTAKGNTDTSFFNLYRRPKSCFDLYLGISASPRFYFSAGLQAVGKRTDIGYDAQYNPVQVTLKGYGLVNFYAEYRVNGERLKCFADLHNITGSKYTEVFGFNTVGFNGAAGIRFGLSKTKH